MSSIDNVDVSIVCETYNLEKYLEVALKSFLMQKTTFKYEILIHDDCSIDDTKNIINKYKKKYPDLIRSIIQEKNKYSDLEDYMIKYIMPNVKGRYVAICQGDDFWIDSYKLQKQYDILEKNKNIKMCGHAAICVDANTLDFNYYIAPSCKERILTPKETIIGNGGFLATNSLFFRREVYDDYPKYDFSAHIDDYPLQLEGSYPNGIYYLNDCMSVYRSMVDNSWSVKAKNNDNIEKSAEKIIEEFNRVTNGEYKLTIKYRKSGMHKMIKQLKYHFIKKYYDKNLDYYYKEINDLLTK